MLCYFTLPWQQGCDHLILLHLGFLDYTRYIITARFFQLEKISVSDIKFYVSNFK